MRLMHLFEELNKIGTTVVVATHNKALVTGFSHPRLHLTNGELSVLKAGTPFAENDHETNAEGLR
jgi:cell division transport system ATP-binding protein